MTTLLESIIPDKYKNVQIPSHLRGFNITQALQNSKNIEEFFDSIVASAESLYDIFDDDQELNDNLSMLEYLDTYSPSIVATILPFVTKDDDNTEFTSTGQHFNPNDFPEPTDISQSQSESLKQLVESQGFLLSDFSNQAMIDDQPFLQQVVDEIDNNSSWETSVLSIYGNLPLEYAILLLEQKIVITQATIGLYNPIVGSGSIFNIEIKEPLVISKDNALISIDEDDDHANAFGYSVSSIYGDPELTISAQTKMPTHEPKAIQLTLDVFN